MGVVLKTRSRQMDMLCFYIPMLCFGNETPCYLTCVDVIQLQIWGGKNESVK